MNRPAVIIVGGGNMVSGREIMMLALARGLAGRGLQPVFITSLWSGRGEFITRLKEAGYEYFRVRLGFLSLSRSLQTIWWTLDQLRYWPALMLGYRAAIAKTKPLTVVHTNWHHALLLLPLLDASRDIYWSHEIIPSSRRYGLVFRAISRRVRLMVCVSHAVARQLIAQGVSSEKVIVIHNGVDIASVGMAVPPGPIIRFGIIGQIAPWKGFDLLLDAIQKLAGQSSRFLLCVFGKGDPVYVDMLRERVKALGVGAAVEWRDFVADQNEIYDNINVCIVPSIFPDPLPTTAIEASLFARPVICTAMGGLSEIVIDGETGFVVPPRPERLAAAIDAFLSHPEMIARMGQAARTRALACFGHTRFIDEFEAVIRRRDVPA